MNDEGELERLLAKHLPTVRAIVTHRMSKMLRTREESLDIVQSACLRALEQSGADVPLEDEPFRAWLTRIVENKLVDRYRAVTALRRGYDRQVGAANAVDEEPHGGDAAALTPSAYAARVELVETVRLAIAELPPELREALYLHEFEGLSYDKLGQRLGLSFKQARYRVAKAKLKLVPVLGRLEARGTEQPE
ncbi:MAG: RNA polymerase sigma factor [bacterium]|nr:RNA polymerase sigma factor [bacterium]